MTASCDLCQHHCCINGEAGVEILLKCESCKEPIFCCSNKKARKTGEACGCGDRNDTKICEDCLEKMIDPEFVERNSDKPWIMWDILSENDDLTPEFIEKYIDKPWDWHLLSNNDNLTEEFIERHLDKPWVWVCFTDNPNLTRAFIQRHSDKIKISKKWRTMRRSKRSKKINQITELLNELEERQDNYASKMIEELNNYKKNVLNIKS